MDSASAVVLATKEKKEKEKPQLDFPEQVILGLLNL